MNRTFLPQLLLALLAPACTHGSAGPAQPAPTAVAEDVAPRTPVTVRWTEVQDQAGRLKLLGVVEITLGLLIASRPVAPMASALGSLVLPGGRGELIQHGGLTVLNDAYNANPASFLAVMDVARAMRGGRRLVFVAGTMRELGQDSARYHREVADALVALAPELLAAVGEFVPALEPHRAVLGDRLLTAPDAVALGPLLAARLQGDELVVLKASRGPALERILPSLGITATAPSH